jgi:hypothetical protein
MAAELIASLGSIGHGLTSPKAHIPATFSREDAALDTSLWLGA